MRRVSDGCFAERDLPITSATCGRPIGPRRPILAVLRARGLLSIMCCRVSHCADDPVVAALIPRPVCPLRRQEETQIHGHTRDASKSTNRDKVTVVTFNDSKIIDEAEIQEFGQELYDLVEREGRKKIVLNFGNVEFLSSAALGKLIGFDKRVKQHGAELDLLEHSPRDLRSLRDYEIDEAVS